MINIESYFLDLKKLDQLDNDKADIIHGYYKELLYSFHDGRKEMAQSIANTLIEAGYLISQREKKLDQLINE